MIVRIGSNLAPFTRESELASDFCCMGERGIVFFGHPASRIFTCGFIIFIVIDHLEFKEAEVERSSLLGQRERQDYHP